MAPTRRQPAKVRRGPIRSQRGPAMMRTRRLGEVSVCWDASCVGGAHVAAKLTMLELATSVVERWRSCLIVRESSGGKAYLVDVSIDNLSLGISRCKLPGPKGYQEAKPCEEEDSAVDIEEVENRNGSGLVVDWIDLWGLPEGSKLEGHGVVAMEPSVDGSC